MVSDTHIENAIRKNRATWAKRLHSWGWCVVPCNGHGALPGLGWSKTQHRRPSDQQIDEWFDRGEFEIGVVTGPLSGHLNVLHFYSKEIYLQWVSLPYAKIRTTLPAMHSNQGTYVFFRSRGRLNSRAFTFENSKCKLGELLAEGELVLLPPTQEPSEREWIRTLEPRRDIPALDRSQLGVKWSGIETPHEAHHYQRPESSVPYTCEVRDDANFGTLSQLFVDCPSYLQDSCGSEQEWVIEGFIPRSYLVVIGGDSKAGKSTFATALAVAVATGQSFLGMPVDSGAVLWVAYEESEGERKLILREYPSPPDGLYITHEKLNIDSKEGLKALTYWTQKVSARLLVIDPLYAATSAESLSDGKTARDVLTGLKELCRTTGVTALVLHHLRKGNGIGSRREQFADSNQILATASMDIHLESNSSESDERQLILRCHGRGAFANQTLHVVSKGVTDFRLIGNPSDERIQPILDCLTAASNPMTAEEIANHLGLRVKTVKNQITDLVKSSTLTLQGQSGRASLYGLAEQPA